jgi:hypothetical protein
MRDDQSKIDELNESLYSRNAPEVRTKRRLRFQKQKPIEVKSDWEHEPEIPREDVELNQVYKDNSMSFFTKIFIASIVFFLLALSAGAFLFFKGSNIVSAKNVDIKVVSPVSVSGGETVPFEIQVVNHNNITLESVNLTVDFPEGTTDVDNSLKELKEFREPMSNIEPGGIGKKNVSAVMYGEENSKKEVRVLVSYRVKGSNATFEKEKIVDVLISSSPISLKVTSFKEVNAGQEFDLTVLLSSNSDEVIKNLLLKAAYPFGFTFISSDLKPLSDNSTWQIGDIPPGGKRSFKIRGKLEGQDDEARIFRFMTGAFSLTNNKVIGTEYTSTSQEVSIKKPFMTIGVALDSNTENQLYIGEFDDPVRVDISYFNNLPTSIIDAEIHVKLSGSAFEKGSVSPDQGLYRSEDNEIIWNSITTRELRDIGAGESGRVSFSVTPRDLSTSQKPLINPELKMDISVSGKRNSEDNVPEKLVSTVQRGIKIASNINLGGQVVRNTGPFKNNGPIPPVAERDTTYTVIWTVDNTTSSISNAQVQSSLPSYVSWVGAVSPSTENIKYNSVDGTLIWYTGSLGARNSNSSRKQVAFQVSLKPSLSQVEETPILVNESHLVAQDDFTGETLRSNLGSLNTRFSTDPSFKEGDEKVIQQ